MDDKGDAQAWLLTNCADDAVKLIDQSFSTPDLRIRSLQYVMV